MTTAALMMRFLFCPWGVLVIFLILAKTSAEIEARPPPRKAKTVVAPPPAFKTWRPEAHLPPECFQTSLSGQKASGFYEYSTTANVTWTGPYGTTKLFLAGIEGASHHGVAALLPALNVAAHGATEPRSEELPTLSPNAPFLIRQLELDCLQVPAAFVDKLPHQRLWSF